MDKYFTNNQNRLEFKQSIEHQLAILALPKYETQDPLEHLIGNCFGGIISLAALGEEVGAVDILEAVTTFNNLISATAYPKITVEDILSRIESIKTPKLIEE